MTALTPAPADGVRERAAAILAANLGRLIPGKPLRNHGLGVAVDALIDLERAFGVFIEVDEAFRLPDLDALLDLVALRVAETGRLAGMQGERACRLYDLAAYRAALESRKRP